MEDYIYISSDDDEWDNNQDYNNDDDDDCEFDDGFSEIEQQSIGICQKAPSCKVL